MIKILHVISDSNFGGAGRLLLNLIAESDKKNFDISVAVPQGSALKPRIETLGVKVFEVSLNLGELRRLIKAQKPQIVHTHAAATARVAARLCGVPVTLNTRHCADCCQTRFSIFRRIITNLFDTIFTSMTIATADYVKNVLKSEGIPPKKIAVIINGSLPLRRLSHDERTAARARSGYKENDFLAGIVARTERGKGQEYFIEAARICEKSHPEIKFLIVGDGSMRKQLQTLGAGLSNLKFLGFLPDVTEIMNILDVNANCSYISETSSLSLSEGMSVGAIPIVSDCGGNPFMAKDCGFTLPQKNAAALAEKLIYLSQNREKAQALKSAATERFFAEFTSSRMAKETEKLYFELLNRTVFSKNLLT